VVNAQIRPVYPAEFPKALLKGSDISTQMRRAVACWARTASEHATVPPVSAMKFRRRMPGASAQA